MAILNGLHGTEIIKTEDMAVIYVLRLSGNASHFPVSPDTTYGLFFSFLFVTHATLVPVVQRIVAQLPFKCLVAEYLTAERPRSFTHSKLET